MSALTFKAVIGSVHFDPKKGIVKIQLEATSHVSLDELTSLGPHDESIQVRLESEQTRIGPSGPITIDEEGVKRLKEAAERLKGGNVESDEIEESPIITEFPTPAAEEEGDSITLSEGEAVKLKEVAERLKESDEEGDEVEGGGQGGII